MHLTPLSRKRPSQLFTGTVAAFPTLLPGHPALHLPLADTKFSWWERRVSRVSRDFDCADFAFSFLEEIELNIPEGAVITAPGEPQDGSSVRKHQDVKRVHHAHATQQEAQIAGRDGSSTSSTNAKFEKSTLLTPPLAALPAEHAHKSEAQAEGCCSTASSAMSSRASSFTKTGNGVHAYGEEDDAEIRAAASATTTAWSSSDDDADEDYEDEDDDEELYDEEATTPRGGSSSSSSSSKPSTTAAATTTIYNTASLAFHTDAVIDPVNSLGSPKVRVLRKCGSCQRCFTTREGYRLHQRASHLNDRPFSCPLCGKSFVRQNDLRLHNIRAHQAERPFPCDDCEKSFASNSELMRHLRCHERRREKRRRKEEEKARAKAAKIAAKTVSLNNINNNN